MTSRNRSKSLIDKIMWTKIFHHLHYPMARQIKDMDWITRRMYEEGLTCLRV